MQGLHQHDEAVHASHSTMEQSMYHTACAELFCLANMAAANHMFTNRADVSMSTSLQDQRAKATSTTLASWLAAALTAAELYVTNTFTTTTAVLRWARQQQQPLSLNRNNNNQGNTCNGKDKDVPDMALHIYSALPMMHSSGMNIISICDSAILPMVQHWLSFC